jgi:hypothetical protein
MPIQRFGAILLSKGEFDAIWTSSACTSRENLDGVMCRSLLSVDYRGYVYDCDFNQMLDLPLARGGRTLTHLSELLDDGRFRQSDPRRRPLLRLHRGPGLQLRRRAEGGGGVISPHGQRSCPLPREAAGRVRGEVRRRLAPGASARPTIAIRSRR